MFTVEGDVDADRHCRELAEEWGSVNRDQDQKTRRLRVAGGCARSVQSRAVLAVPGTELESFRDGICRINEYWEDVETIDSIACAGISADDVEMKNWRMRKRLVMFLGEFEG